jgi:hypoxanthine-guanine phosphoribosyltransferase
MVSKIAQQISKDYADKHPIFIGVLNGAFMFMADLIRALDPNLKF